MNTYSPTYSDDDDEMGDIVEAYAEQEAADRPTDTDNARRRHLAEMTRQAFADGLYETSAADYAEALRRARAEPTTDIAEDAWEVIVRVRDDYPRVINDAPTEEIVEALADAGLLATARTVNVHPTYTVEYQQKIADELGVEREAVLRALGLAAPLLATARTVTTAHECDSGDFDRTICDCGAMHSYCTGCGTRQDDCPHGTTTEEWPRCKASRDGGCDRCHDEHGRHIHCRAEGEATATDEDAARVRPQIAVILARHAQSVLAREGAFDSDETSEAIDAILGLLATARTRPTREQIARALREGRTNGLCTLGVRCDLCDCAQDYEDDLALRDADAVLALYTYQPTRDDLARAIASGYEPDHPTPNRHDYRAADAVLALFNEKGD